MTLSCLSCRWSYLSLGLCVHTWLNVMVSSTYRVKGVTDIQDVGQGLRHDFFFNNRSLHDGKNVPIIPHFIHFFYFINNMTLTIKISALHFSHNET